MDNLLELLHAAFDRLPPLTWANSKELIASLLGALAGAWFGAWAARKGAASDKERDVFLAEIRAINAAGSLCFSIINNAVSLKKQHLLPMVQRFEEQVRRISAIEQARAVGQFPQNQVVTFVADLQLLPTMVLPTAELRHICLEKLTLSGRPMAAVNVLHQCAVALDMASGRRAKLVEQSLADRRSGKDPMPLAQYFGLPDKDGHVNTDWPDTLKAIYKMLEDVIYFAWLLSEDLAKHGDDVSLRYKKRFGKRSLPMVRRADFSKAKSDGLMPDEAQYKDWLSAFPSVQRKTLRERVLEALPFVGK